MLNSKNQLAWVPSLLILYNFCANLANDIYLPTMPTLADLFSASSNTLQLTMTAWFAGIAFPQLFFGPLTDRFGRRPILLSGGVCFLVATLLCASANGIITLTIGRFLQGVGVCSLNVSSFSILTDLYTYKNRTQIMNKISMFSNLAPLIGPVVGGYVFVYCGWRANFLVIFLLGAASVYGLWLKLPESNLNLNPNALKLRYIYINYLSLLRNKYFLKHLIPYCLLLGGLIAYITAAPFIIIHELKIPPQFFGYTQLPIFIAYTLGSLYLGRVKEEARIKQLLERGMQLVFFAGLLVLITNCAVGDHLLSIIIPMALYVLGFSLCASPLISEVMMSVGELKGYGAAFLGFGMATSCMLSSLLVGILYTGSGLSIASLLFVMVAIALTIYLTPSENIPVETYR